MNGTHLHSAYVAGKRIDESFGRYRLICKIGSYCEFGYDQISNQRHHHDCYELCIVISGSGIYICDDTIRKIQEGDILIADPNEKHEIRASSKESLVLLYIFISIEKNLRPTNIGSFGEACVEEFLKGHLRITSKRNLLSYIAFIEEYNYMNNQGSFGTHEALKNLVLESINSLSLTRRSSNDEVVKNTFERALDYIDSNLHTRIFVSAVADYSCTTPRNLEYIFRRQLSSTVNGYINEKKIALACHYLSMCFSVSDAAEKAGIFNLSQFSTMFKKHKQISPKEYRDQFLNERKGMGRRI